MRYTKKQFEADFPDDDACLEAVFQNRFGDLKYCPVCENPAKFYRVKKRQCYACQHCAFQLFPLADTIFRKTTTPLKDWFYAIYLFSVAKNGVSAKELERHLGVTYKTAWRMCKQIRLLMAQEAGDMTGTVEIDEAYIGGKRSPKKRYTNKTAVVGVIERNGETRAVAAHRATKYAAEDLLIRNVRTGSSVYTDESKLYNQVKKFYKHELVRHSDKEYVRGIVHTNSIESFWGQLKRSLDGTYHCVSPKYLQLYVDEFVFRYNFRGVAVGPVLLEKATKHVL